METLIGFAIGYWAGTRDGREGVTKALAALNALANSDQLKNLVSQGVQVGGQLVAKSLSGQSGGNALAANVMGVVADRAGRLLGGGLRAA
jgi:hypothetical protein